MSGGGSGSDSAVASIYDRHDDSDVRARAALTMLGVQRGWRVADIGCGNGVLACEAALMGAEVDAIDISPAMLALAEIQARDRKVAIRTQSAGLLSFAYQPNSYDLIVSEFTLHHLPDFWKAVALSRIFCALKPGASFYLRDIVFVSMPDGAGARRRAMGGVQHQEPRFRPRQRDDPYARRVFDLRLGDRADADRCRLHAGVGGLSRAAARHLSAAETETRRAGLEEASMKPADVFLAVLVAVIWGLAFVASRLALDEFSPALMTAMRFAIAALPCLFVRRPNVSWTVLIAISGTLFLGQFLAQSWAIAHGVPVGLSSVIVQSQALFTVAFAAVAFREIPTAVQVVGIGVAAIGLLMICGTVGYDFSVGAFAVLMTSPISFAIGNLLLRQARDVPMFDLFAWLCLVPPLPLLALAFAVDGPQATWQSLWQMSLTGWASMLFVGAISTSIAYWLWGRLLRDHTAAQVVPFALLVPFVGSAASSVVFGETFGPLRLAGMITVVGGIAVMLLSKRSQALPKIA